MELKNRLSSPRVSVVIVNYNGSQWLKMFMPYLVKTRYPDFEIIVVDNASKDESIQYLKNNFAYIKLVLLSENKGFAEGTNIGVNYSTGEVLAFLNNDMEVNYDWLMNAVSKLTSDNAVAAVQCKIMQYYARDKIDCLGLSVDRYDFFLPIGYSETDKGQYDSLEEIGACSGGAMLIWKDIFLDLGCFDPLFFMYYEDVDLSWRIKLAGFKICPAVSSVVYHVGSGSSNLRSSNGWNPSPFFAFLFSRNTIYCWLKNSSLQTMVIYWPVFLFGNLLVSSYLVPNVSFKAGFEFFKGLFWPVKHSRYILNQRKKMQYKVGKQNKDNLLFVDGIIKESSNLLNIVKRTLHK